MRGKFAQLNDIMQVANALPAHQHSTDLQDQKNRESHHLLMFALCPKITSS